MFRFSEHFSGLLTEVTQTIGQLGEVVKSEVAANNEAVVELVDRATLERFKEQRELISRSDTLTAEVLECETDEEDLLVRFDVSLLRKNGSTIKRVRGNYPMARAMAANGLAEAPEQLEGVLTSRVIRPLVGALQQVVTDVLLPPQEEDPLPALLPPVEEPPSQSAEQGNQLQGDPGPAGQGSNLH